MPSQIRITADDRGPLVNLANWITLVVACLATLTKIATKMRKIRNLQGDDYIMLAAMVCFFFFSLIYIQTSFLEQPLMLKFRKPFEQLSAVGQSIAVGKQVSVGLGRHISTLTDSQIEEYQKVRIYPSSSSNIFHLVDFLILDRIHRRIALYPHALPSQIRRPAFP